ncbi:MAG: hypothetical protein ACYTG4_04185 [Planctomycetota bacterium]|jgi:hypothetical protein
MRKSFLSLRKKFLASLLATLIILTPAARAQSFEDLLWRRFLGNMIIVTVLVFIVVKTQYPYAEGREGADREKSLKDKVKLEDQEVSVNVYDDWFTMSGLSPSGGVERMEGSITTKNHKVYKIFSYDDEGGQEDFNDWVADYVDANGSESVDIASSSMKGPPETASAARPRAR